MSEGGPPSSDCCGEASAATEAREGSEPQGWSPAGMRWLVVGWANGQQYLQSPPAEGGECGVQEPPFWAPVEWMALDPPSLKKLMPGDGLQLAWPGAPASTGAATQSLSPTEECRGRCERPRMPGVKSLAVSLDEQQAEEDRKERNRRAQRVFREKQKKTVANLTAQLKELGDKVHELEKRNAALQMENEILNAQLAHKGCPWGLKRPPKDV